jgi:hypothetical protein
MSSGSTRKQPPSGILESCFGIFTCYSTCWSRQHSREGRPTGFDPTQRSRRQGVQGPSPGGGIPADAAPRVVETRCTYNHCFFLIDDLLLLSVPDPGEHQWSPEVMSTRFGYFAVHTIWNRQSKKTMVILTTPCDTRRHDAHIDHILTTCRGRFRMDSCGTSVSQAWLAIRTPGRRSWRGVTRGSALRGATQCVARVPLELAKNLG